MTEKEILTNGTAVYTNAVHRVGSDGVLLARFCHIHRQDIAADFGTGCGIIALTWHDEGHRGPCVALDISADAVALVQAAVQAADAGHIVPICADLRTYQDENAQHFDVIACNPPYFTAGQKSSNAQRAAARHEGLCTLEEVCAAGYPLLRDGGKLCLCAPPTRLADAMCAMRAHRIEPKRLQFARANADAAPWLFLLEGQKHRAPGLTLEKEICLQAVPAAQYGRK